MAANILTQLCFCPNAVLHSVTFTHIDSTDSSSPSVRKLQKPLYMLSWSLQWRTLMLLTHECQSAKKIFQFYQPCIPPTAEVVRDMQQQDATARTTDQVMKAFKSRIALQPDRV